MKKERIEDLGKLSILIKELFYHDLFIDLPWKRPKDASETFFQLDDNNKDDVIRRIAYQLDEIREKIADCLEIANGDEE